LHPIQHWQTDEGLSSTEGLEGILLYEVEEVDFDGFQIEFCGGGDCMIIMNQDQNC